MYGLILPLCMHLESSEKIEMKIKNRVIKSQNDRQSPEIPFLRKFFTLGMAQFVLSVETLLGLLLT